MPAAPSTTSSATHPGNVSLSDEKLRALEPELFENRTFKCGPICPVDHPAADIRAGIARHLRLGDSRPAVVVSLTPLVVAADSVDLDAAILLEYPSSFVDTYRLTIGTRLVSVNTYGDLRNPRTGKVLYAVDVIPGPDRTGWSNVTPLVADFLTDEREKLVARKRTIEDAEWTRLEANTKKRIAKWGLRTARPGKPSLAGTPVRVHGGANSFAELEDASPVRRKLELAIVVGSVVLLAASGLAALLR